VEPLAAVSFSDIASAVADGLWFAYYVGIQLVACLVLGYLTARKTGRSVFNWLVLGFINSLIPLFGFLLMLSAYFFYPAPAPRAGPGYQPRRESRDPRRGRRPRR
jgi:hypothetical protein